MPKVIRKDQHGHVLRKPYQCRYCGGYDDAEAWAHIKLPEKSICFGCNFWQEHADNASDPNSVRVDGTHYYVGREDGNGYGSRGFGGQRFVIHFRDGRKVTTTNLWYQGKIPSVWRKQLPDNARFYPL